MSSRVVSARERRRLRDVAREYEKQGYRVYVDPAAQDLPRFLRELDFRPDALALSAADSVVIEVRSEETLAHDHDLEDVTRAVQDRPGWRVELVVTNPRPAKHAEVSRSTPASEANARKALQSAEKTLDRMQELVLQAAVELWLTAELSLGEIAESEPLERKEVPALLKTLHSRGLYDAHDLASLESLYEIRSYAVHHAQLSTTADVMKQIHVALDAVRRLDATAFFLPILRDRLLNDLCFKEAITDRMRAQVQTDILRLLPVGSDPTAEATQVDHVELDAVEIGAVLDAANGSVWVGLSTEAELSISYMIDPDYLEGVADETLAIIEPDAAAYAAQVAVERAAYLEFSVLFDRETQAVEDLELNYAAPKD